MYYSQFQQDQILNNVFFKNNKNGVFVDVGAHDGVSISNSLFFEKELNWTGICVEPIPKVFEKLKNNRKCICLETAVGNETGTVSFTLNTGYTEMLSGITKLYDPLHVQRINREISQFSGGTTQIQVSIRKLSDVFEEHNIKVIDYLSIDTEGAELEIIKGINFNNVHINVIGYEANYRGSPEHLETRKILENNGFKFTGNIHCDDIYQNTNLRFSWENSTN
jgi:FkbM family methyltransferase